MTTETFKIVVASTGGTLNHIVTAPYEKDSDTLEARVKARREHAEKMAQAWSYNYFNHTENLLVVPCDPCGRPI